MVLINSGGGAGSGTAGKLVAPLAAAVAMIADDALPGTLGEIQKNQVKGPPTHEPKSEENKDKKFWIEIELVDEEGQPMAGEAYEVTVPDGSVQTGSLDDKGFAHIANIDSGNCQVTFPNLDQDAWEEG